MKINKGFLFFATTYVQFTVQTIP